MRIAVFLDVDNTLTTDFIQKQYAKALGCEAEYEVLEGKFQKEANSKAFGDELVKLFAAKGFTEKKAREVFDQVSLQKWTDGLLRLADIDKYLVSSGPNYYIDVLAERYKIPDENIFRSVYKFSQNPPFTIESCEAVSDQNKAKFVNERKGKYDITIGVGDSEKHDGPFLSQVTIPLLRGHTDEYISVTDFQSVILLINSLSQIAETAQVFDPGSQTIVQMVKSITINNWVWIVTALCAVFGAGTAVGHLWK